MKKTLTSSPRKLPLDVEEEILVRVPPRSLVRFRSVCKAWNTLYNDKRFANKQLPFARPELLLKTHSHIYSINVDLNKDDPTIKVTDLRVDLRGRSYDLYCICDGHLFIYDFHEGGGEGLVLNPFLRQPKWIVVDVISYGKGMGYSGNRHDEKSYKIIGNVNGYLANVTDIYSVFHFATNEWKVTEHISFYQEPKIISESRGNARVSLNGNLYWTACTYPETGQCFIQMLDFSKEIRKVFCVLPCKGGKSTRILSVYKGDRFSVLEQSIETRAIEIWVTKDKIGNGDDDGDDVVWVEFMTIPIPNFPMLLCNNSTSYFVDNNVYGKSFVSCFLREEPREAWVYIVRGDVCKKIKIDQVDCQFQSSAYVPSLINILDEASEEEQV